MKAFDAFLDRGARDSGFDLTTSRSLSREVTNAYRLQVADHQRMSVATNYFALACPIMPIGVLGLFMLLGKLDEMWSQHMFLKPGKGELYDRLAEQSREAYLLRAKQQLEANPQPKIEFQCSRSTENIKGSDKPKKRKETDFKHDEKPAQRFDRPNLLSKSQNDASKLIKQKMALEEHLEKISGEQNYHLYCRVSAQLELLDKALKKLGS
jgi:hypothetical protein